MIDDKDRKKKMVLIGRSAAGKTTLCQRINNEDLKYHKTQTVQLLNNNMIDTPGEYLEQRFFRGALKVTAADADIIAFVQDATEHNTMFPPAYASSFGKPTIGIVTKCDLVDEKQIKQSRAVLQLAGASQIFDTSSVTGHGIDKLVEYLSTLENQ